MNPDTSGARRAVSAFRSQAGAGMLGVIALMSVSFVLVQGTLFYKSRSSAAFIASEKNKILAPVRERRRAQGRRPRQGAGVRGCAN